MAEMDKEVIRITHEVLKGRNLLSDPIPFERKVGDLLFSGEFVFKRASRGIQNDIAVKSAVLVSAWNPQIAEYVAVQVDERDRQFARAQATLEFVVHSAPAWWDMDLICEPEIILGVAALYWNWEGSFRSAVAQTPQPGAKGNGA